MFGIQLDVRLCCLEPGKTMVWTNWLTADLLQQIIIGSVSVMRRYHELSYSLDEEYSVWLCVNIIGNFIVGLISEKTRRKTSKFLILAFPQCSTANHSSPSIHLTLSYSLKLIIFMSSSTTTISLFNLSLEPLLQSTSCWRLAFPTFIHTHTCIQPIHQTA